MLTCSLTFSVLLFNYSLWIFYSLNVLTNGLSSSYYLIESCNTLGSFLFKEALSVDSFSFFIGVDSLSLVFIILTTFLLPPVILYSFNYFEDKNLHVYLLLLFALNFLLLNFFLTVNILAFYIFFEIVLIPVFIMIILWGSRSRKILAALYFFIYTFIGSIFFLFALLVIYSETATFNLDLLLNYSYTINSQLLLWPCIAIALIVKIPMVPFHLWLPEAHVEAPTIGSVYLASLLLKLGGYGFLRILLPLFPYGTIVYSPVIQLLALTSMVYCSFLILRQVDLKKIIAYSSIIHMNLAVFGLFTYNLLSIQGAVLLMLAHGITSGALFFLIGFLYDRHNTRMVTYYGGLVTVMPIFSFLFIFFSFCNIGFPGTMNFTSELLLFIGIIKYGIISKTFLFISFISIALFSSVCYSIWLVNKIIFGNFKAYNSVLFYDLTEREVLVLTPFVFYIILFGLVPFCLQVTADFAQELLILFGSI